MPKKLLKPSSEPLALLYRNGQPFTSNELDLHIPHFSDICLTRDSQDQCDDAIELANSYDHAVHSEDEWNDYVALHSLVDELLEKLRTLAKKDRERFVKICSQQAAGIDPSQTKLTEASNLLRKRVVEWRETINEGKRREEERLRAKAEEKQAEAKYTDDPKKARKAKVEAQQLIKEAEEVAPRPAKGVDTEQYAEFDISNRVLAAKLPDELVPMSVNEREGNRRLKAMKQAGEKLTPNVFPGLAITWKTKVRFH
jgi:hypothetical protein